MVRTEIWSEGEAVEHLARFTEKDLKKTLLLKKHEAYPTYFYVDGFTPSFIYDLKEVVGPYRAVSMFKLGALREAASKNDYTNLIYIDDPTELLERVDHLNDPYEHDITVTLRKFQLQGFNFIRDLKADIVNWSTGTGKSVLAVAKAKYLLETGKVDRVIVASRNHNRINWQRQFKAIGNLEAAVAEAAGSTAVHKRLARAKIYNESQIVILNYEKFRFRSEDDSKSSGDGQELTAALKNQRVYFIYDEMPMYLKNPNTLIYKGLKKVLRATKDKYQTMLSATPIDNIPEDVFYCIKILSPKTLGTVKEFRANYGKTYNRFAKWKVKVWDREKLEELGMKLAHMTHKADKYKDPEIRAEFPQESWEDIIIDWSPQDYKLYQWAVHEIKKGNVIGFDNHVLQLICNNPAFLEFANGQLAIALRERFKLTDAHSAKLETLRQMLKQIDGKVVVFSSYNDLGARPLSKYLNTWNIPHVLYDGKQEALDLFRENDRIKVFLSSDQGSDSINLPEATSVINYDLPWKFTTLIQRVNRVNRLDSEYDQVFYYNLIMAHSMEERKLEVISQKQSYDEAVFGKDISDQSDILNTIDKDTLWYILVGE